MSAIQVLNLFLNPFAGRANRQQFLFFVLIYVLFVLWAEILFDEYKYGYGYSSYKVGFFLAGCYFLLVGFSLRFRDAGINILKGIFLFGTSAAMVSVGVVLFLFALLLPIFLFIQLIQPEFFSILSILISCSFFHLDSFCPAKADAFSHSIFPENFLITFSCIFIVIPLAVPESHKVNKYGPPPVGFDLRTMLAATYPAHLLKAQVEEGEAV